ncbi:MAG: hypothetical protein KF736_09930 [Acidobacteria bacterium]|nr:hypothetical protein [Acidobacteriota bacterium]MCW5949824.1 hypothetical protein [Pyrinomonadaceae bacterium]
MTRLTANIAGFYDEQGRFRPIRSPRFIGGSRKRPSARHRKYSRAKAGDLGKERQARALESPWDKEYRLKQEAAAALAAEQKRLEAQFLAEAIGDNQSQTLAQFVRSRGGIRRTFRHGGMAARGKRSSWDAGEIDRLTLKGSGSTGLTTSRPDKGLTMDKMFQAARAAGYNVDSIDDMMDAIETEAAGGRAVRSTHGSLDYTDNPHFVDELQFKQQLAEYERGARRTGVIHVLSRPTHVLQMLGIKNKPVVLSVAKLTALLRKHSDVTVGIVKGLIEELETPLMVFRSAARKDSLVVITKIVSRGKPYVASFYISQTPGAKHAISSLYVKDDPRAITSWIDKRLLLYVDKSLSGKLLAWLQLPLSEVLRRSSTSLKTNDDLVKHNPLDPITAFAAGANGILAAMNINRLMNDKPQKKRTTRRANPGGRFAVGDVLSTRFSGDYDNILTGRVVDRKGAFVIFTLGNSSERIRKRILIDADGSEYIFPLGRYSMAPVFRAGNTAKNPTPRKTAQAADTGTLYLLTIMRGDDLEGVFLHDGKNDGFEKKFATIAAAKAWATRNKKAVKNPGRLTAGLKRFIARQQAKRELGRELRTEAKLSRIRSRKQKALAAAVANPDNYTNPAARRRRNPKPVPHRRTFELFQGRPATTATPMPVTRFAPAKLDQLGDLIEIKLADGRLFKFNGKSAKLCAARGKLWIAGRRFAQPNPSRPANAVDRIGEIDHVVYGTYKPHHGDHAYTHYIHRLGEETGHRPTLCVDRDGFPLVRGGRYKIEARGIVN